MTLTGISVLLLSSVAFISYGVVTARRNLVTNVEVAAEITAANVTPALLFDDANTAGEILSKLQSAPTLLKAALYAPNGHVFAHYPQNMADQNFPPAQATQISRFGPGVLEFYYPIWDNGKRIGELYIQSDLSPLYERIRLYTVIILLVIVSGIAIVLVLARWLQGQISRPILELARAARIVSEKRDYTVRAQSIGKDELGALTDAFNHMLTQIQDRDQALRKSQDDLTDLNRSLEERVTQRTSELATANKELEAFTYSVSHDLRAPLRHIDAFAQIVQDETKTNPSPTLRRYVDRIRVGVQNMGLLIDDLLNLSRVARAEVAHQPIRLNDLIDEVLIEMKPETENRNIEWHIGRLPMAQCDPGLMKQVFMNLIANAIKYTRPRQQAVITVDTETVNGQTAIFVRDNGVGFDNKYAEKLFGVFQRLHRAEEFEGTGVGLAIVKRILDLHQGRIWAQSDLDKGATFWFSFKGLSTQAQAQK
jgi:signal transduction histidine kinase